MKIAVVTANIGGIDKVLPMPEQTTKYDRFIYTESNLPFPLPNLDNRTKARYLKINLHRFLPEYDVFIWLDGRVKVTSNQFVHIMSDFGLNGSFNLTEHPDRKSVFEEMEFILYQMNSGNNYLISRYGKQSIRLEYDFYKDKLRGDAQLFASGIFARKNNEECNSICAEWWLRTLEFTNLDQAMLCYCIEKSKIIYDTLPYINDYYKVLKHKPVKY